jgi:hypothetical protein
MPCSGLPLSPTGLHARVIVRSTMHVRVLGERMEVSRYHQHFSKIHLCVRHASCRAKTSAQSLAGIAIRVSELMQCVCWCCVTRTVLSLLLSVSSVSSLRRYDNLRVGTICVSAVASISNQLLLQGLLKLNRLHLKLKTEAEMG